MAMIFSSGSDPSTSGRSSFVPRCFGLGRKSGENNERCVYICGTHPTRKVVGRITSGQIDVYQKSSSSSAARGGENKNKNKDSKDNNDNKGEHADMLRDGPYIHIAIVCTGLRPTFSKI